MAHKLKYDPNDPEFDKSIVGNTPFGLFDDDPEFVKDAPKVRKWVAKRLGWPQVDIEITEIDIYAAFEEAVMEYSKLVNEYNIKDNLFSLKGTTTDKDLTGKYVGQSKLPFAIKLSEDYGAEVGAGGKVKHKKDFIEMGPDPDNLNKDMPRNYTQDGQVYDLVGYMHDKLGVDRDVVIKNIFHHEPPYWGVRQGGQGDNDSGIFGLAIAGNHGGVRGLEHGSRYLLTDVSETLAHMQGYQFNQTVKASRHDFELIGGMVKIHPPPRFKRKLWFEFVFEDELKEGEIKGVTPTVTNGVVEDEGAVISDISNIPYDVLPYFQLNNHAKRWILRYTLAISMHKLGTVRSKFQDSIPTPMDDINLDGSTLREDGREMMDSLIESLKETLEDLTKTSQYEKMREEAEALQEYLKTVPMKIYVD